MKDRHVVWVIIGLGAFSIWCATQGHVVIGDNWYWFCRHNPGHAKCAQPSPPEAWCAP